MAAEAAAGIRPLADADPRTVGPYRLTGRLGSGGMGSVFAGVDQFERRVAIKIVHAQFADDREFRARFQREVDLLRRVQGTCTTPVLDADVDAAQPWFACEYVPGPTLQERVDRHGPMSGDELFALAAGLAEALVALHAVGIVHRDLKPQNVVCSPAGPRVLDLGIARSMEDNGLTRTGMMIGSPAWMSPERFRGQTSTPAADVYAWAMMVAYAATGVIPFGTGAPEVVALRVLQEEADTAGVPGSLRGIVDWSADKDPLRRPSATQVLETVTGTWRGSLGAGRAPVADAVSDATSLINMHWKAPADGTAWGSPVAAPPQGPGQGQGHGGFSGFHDNYGSFGSTPPPPSVPPPPMASGGYPVGPPPRDTADTIVGDVPVPEERPSRGRSRGARSGRGGSGRNPKVIAAAVAGVVAVVAIGAALLANSGKKDEKANVEPVAQSSAPPRGTVVGPGPFSLQGVTFAVPQGWDVRPMADTSMACVAPVETAAAARVDCAGGLKVWVGDASARKVALADPNGWTLGKAAACPGAASGAKKATARTSGRQFSKLGPLTYEYAQYTVTCADGSKIEPQVWWLPKSKISFSTTALPKTYDTVVTALIASMDKAKYKAPKGD